MEFIQGSVVKPREKIVLDLDEVVITVSNTGYKQLLSVFGVSKMFERTGKYPTIEHLGCVYRFDEIYEITTKQ
jgi:hypothetical protein